jgi:excisionase family DNA binding protein
LRRLITPDFNPDSFTEGVHIIIMTVDKPKKRRNKYRKTPSLQYLTRAEAAALVGCHPMTVTRLEKRGLFPPAVRLGSGTVRYERSAIDRYLAAAVSR